MIGPKPRRSGRESPHLMASYRHQTLLFPFQVFLKMAFKLPSKLILESILPWQLVPSETVLIFVSKSDSTLGTSSVGAPLFRVAVTIKVFREF